MLGAVGKQIAGGWLVIEQQHIAVELMLAHLRAKRYVLFVAPRRMWKWVILAVMKNTPQPPT
jgi:hypothetical protein